MFIEPAPFSEAACEALYVWELMGCELRIEALPVILAMHPECDPDLLIRLLRVIAAAVRSSA